MQFLYSEESGSSNIRLTGDEHRYIFKVRRHKADDPVFLRNLKDQILYKYRILSIDKKEAILTLESQSELRVQAKKSLHIGWCMIDPKSIEKTLPSLNETGVEKITFIHCKRSQKSFRPDFKRMKKILLNSSQQCGRSVMMELDYVESPALFLQNNPQSWILNFSDKNLSNYTEAIDTLIIGPEGGFCDEEISLFDSEKTVGFDIPMILRSESAVCAAASKIIL